MIDERIVDGKLQFDVILKDDIAPVFIAEAEENERGLSPHARYCIKRYYEWKPEIVRLREIERDFKKLQEEAARLRLLAAGVPPPVAHGQVQDFRPKPPPTPDLQETA